MEDGPYWVILLMYGSHDMRHASFHRLTVVNGTLGFWGVTIIDSSHVGHGGALFSATIYDANENMFPLGF